MNPLALIEKASAPVLLWIMAGLVAISGVLYVRMETAESDLAKSEANTAAIGSTAQRQVDATHATQETTIAAADTAHNENLNHEITDIDSHRAPVAAALSGCASSPPSVLPVAITCPKPPPVPAKWMQPPSNSVELVHKMFSISKQP